ncbi:MAG: hypothetical protein G01um101416_210 [Microgenomates group bacterium Gr01-1014_16]|nr:MAG: hypothetical protein G01um101416_210 [Microgenomates group bacterium Gr01-1014_16]
MSQFYSAFLSVWLAFWNWGGNHPPPPSNHTLDLLINGQNDPVAVVNITDAKPGDDWNIDKDLFVKNKDAKIYLHLKDLVATDGAQTEPELQEPSQSDLHNHITYSVLNYSNSLPDMVSCWIPLDKIKKNQHLTITQGFHFDKDVTNWAQGDVLTFTEEFTAVEGTGPAPDTGSGRVWDKKIKKCVDKKSDHDD